MSHLCFLDAGIRNAQSLSVSLARRCVYESVVVWAGVGWCSVVWTGERWCGLVWAGVTWCGLVWAGVGWCGLVCVCGGWWGLVGAGEERRLNI